MEYSECCGANRHHIYNELCADNISEDTYEAFIECREKLIELMNENNIEL